MCICWSSIHFMIYQHLFVTCTATRQLRPSRGSSTGTSNGRTEVKGSPVKLKSQFIIQLAGRNYQITMLIKIQPDATLCRHLFTAKSLYMFRVSQHPSSGVLKTVTATSGTGHNIGTATFLQRGLIGREVAVPI